MTLHCGSSVNCELETGPSGNLLFMLEYDLWKKKWGGLNSSWSREEVARGEFHSYVGMRWHVLCKSYCLLLVWFSVKLSICCIIRKYKNQRFGEITHFWRGITWVSLRECRMKFRDLDYKVFSHCSVSIRFKLFRPFRRNVISIIVIR